MTNSKKGENYANETVQFWERKNIGFYQVILPYALLFVNVYNYLTTYLPRVYIRLQFTNHPPTPICKRKLWTAPYVIMIFWLKFNDFPSEKK